MHAPLLQVQDLHFAHPGAPSPVFHGLSADLPAGVGLVCGDESAGKSTLLRLLAGALAPSGGRLLLAGERLRPQDVAWFDPLDPGRDEQVAGDILAHLTPGVAPAELSALVQGLSLEPHLPKPLYQLSTGSRRKVFLAAALARQARLTLLDQPFMALDRPSITFLLERFKAWGSQPERLLLLADYLPPEDLPLSGTLDLDRLG